jgi:alpha-beta hydrolase superfamily lysophospholipase
MEAVAALPSWQEQMTRNPANRARMLAQDPQTFVDTMQRWARSFFPVDDSPICGVTEQQLASIKVPTIVLNSGKSDMHHPRYLTEALAKLIPGAKLCDPPWHDTAWNDLLESEGMSMYQNWALLAPQLAAHAKTVWPK